MATFKTTSVRNVREDFETLWNSIIASGGAPSPLMVVMANKKRLDEKLSETDFRNRYPTRKDADHWATLDSDISAQFTKGMITERTDFFVHMLTAFANGERFIVAKLAWNGGAQ
ncbi:hypothetical protein [Rhizobium altiplani]|nr:hypothetical protein [Rhizobium altiplani]